MAGTVLVHATIDAPIALTPNVIDQIVAMLAARVRFVLGVRYRAQLKEADAIQRLILSASVHTDQMKVSV